MPQSTKSKQICVPHEGGPYSYWLDVCETFTEAVLSDDVKVANQYHGSNSNPIELAERIQCHLLGCYLCNDEDNKPSTPAI